MTNYYSALGISRNASGEEIRDAYRRHVMEFHPDRNPDLIDASRFREIQEAYEALGDVERRKSYDEALEAGRSKEAARAADWSSGSSVRPARERPPVWPRYGTNPFEEAPLTPDYGRDFVDLTYFDSGGIEEHLRRILERFEDLFYGGRSDDRFGGGPGWW